MTMTGRHLALFLTLAACLPTARSPADEPAKADKPAADSMVGNEAGDVRDDNGSKMKLVWCAPGVFVMEKIVPPATPGRAPRYNLSKMVQAKVIITQGYWLGKYELTQAEWKRVMATRPWKGQEYSKDEDDYPVANVNWDDAMEFCRRLTDKERKAGRLPDRWEYTLPTDAQWERACRARTETNFSFGDGESNLDEYAWFYDNAWEIGEQYAHRVGQKKPNPWGLHDVHGNVMEWCRDFDSDDLPGGRDPEVTKESASHVVRGGCWARPGGFCSSANRKDRILPQFDLSLVGFRVALTPVQPAK